LIKKTRKAKISRHCPFNEKAVYVQVEGVVGTSGRSALDTGFTFEEEELKLKAQEVRTQKVSNESAFFNR
jgi:hypothetical protein